jgi:phosphohistidine phosphatase
MGVHLAGLGLLPARVLSSDSARTQETWEHLAPALGANTAVHFDRDLYLAGFSALSRHLCAMEDGVDCVLAIGHNPGWERTAGLLVGETVVMTTANVAVLTTDAEDWATAMRSEGDWRLIALYRPRDLR